MRKILFFTLLFGVAQSQPVTTYSNVKVYDGMNTTYRDLGSKSVGGISTGNGSASNSFGVRVVGGSASTTFVNSNATINAVPESAGQVRLGGQINYNTPDIQKAWKSRVSGGVPKGMGKTGWLGVLESTLGAHSQACITGNIDFLCWGKYTKVPVENSDTQGSSKELNEWRESILNQTGYTRAYWAGGCSHYVNYPASSGSNASYFDFKVSFKYFDTYAQAEYRIVDNGNWPEAERCSAPGGVYSTATYTYSSEVDFVETFVPFTPKDLDGIDLPMESMSDADFALVQDSIEPTTITLEPINTFTYDNVVTTYDKDGNKIDVHTTTTATPTINNNNTSSPSVDTQVTTKQDTYTNGSLTGSTSTTTVVNGNTTNNYYQSEYDKNDLTCKGSNCSGQGIKTPTNSGKITSSNQLYQPKNTDELPDFILSKVPTVDNSKIASELQQLIPDLPVGVCPVWTIQGFEVMGIVVMHPTTIDIPCWIYDLIGALIMIGAVVYSRTIIMGA